MDIFSIYRAAGGYGQHNFDVRAFLRQAGVSDWSQSGDEYNMRCPRALTHHRNRDRNWSFYVTSTGAFFCHGCHVKGGRRDLFELFELDGGQIEGCFTATEPQAFVRVPKEKPKLPEEYEPFVSWRKHQDAAGGEMVWLPVPEYLYKERGMTESQIVNYRVGICREGMYKNRVIFPVYSGGELQGFSARYIGTPPEGEKKVLFPKGMKASEILYNMDRVVGQDRVVVVEGVFDVFALERADIPVVSVFGSTISKFQASLLCSFPEVVLMPDADDAGWGMVTSASERNLSSHCRLKVCRLPKGDPADYSGNELKKFLGQAALVRRVF